MEGMVVAGYLLLMQLCQLDGDKLTECRAVPPKNLGAKYTCEAAMGSILEQFPSIRPEHLGYDEGVRLHIDVKCVPLYQPASA
jgi:hypothetical protein